MKPVWIFWLIFVMVAGSVAFELATGVARVRGKGRFTRQQAPRAYWTSVVLKSLFAAVLLGAALFFRRF